LFRRRHRCDDGRVPHLLPRIDPEPPPGYVDFVARHLEPLRRDAERVTGDERGADWLYPEVLMDVATRWPWFELTRRWLRRPRTPDTFLHHAFERRLQQWHTERTGSVDVEVRPIDVWSGDVAYRRPPDPPEWSSAAVRLAPFLAGRRTVTFSPVAEAAIAWWHAYDTYRRRLLIGGVTVAVLVFAFLLQFTA
jgi:hypothetical protein